MKVLAIYGASGLGREILELADQINQKENKWDKMIFVDDGDVPPLVNNHEVNTYEQAIEKYSSGLELVLGIGEPSTREKIFGKIKRDGFETPTLIHPNVYIPNTTHIGKGVVIQFGCFISCNVQIHDYVFIQPQCNIGHDDILEEGCMLAGFSNIGGIVHIGKYTYVGLSAAIKQTVNIGDNAIISMGSIVHKDVPSEMIAMGNPARVIAKNETRKVFGN